MIQRPPNVVVLSSDEHVCERIAYWLTTSGHRPSIAGSGYAARRTIAEGVTKLLITDRLLPPWPGLDTIFGLKQSISGLTIAYLSDGAPDNRRLGLQAGADLILPNPLRRAHVLEAVAHADPAGRLECAS